MNFDSTTLGPAAKITTTQTDTPKASTLSCAVVTSPE